jgi:hypothetical protein
MIPLNERHLRRVLARAVMTMFGHPRHRDVHLWTVPPRAGEYDDSEA